MGIWYKTKRVRIMVLAFLATLVLSGAMGTGAVFAQPDIQKGTCKGLAAAGVPCTDGKTDGDGDARPIVAVVIDALSVVGGAVAVIMIIIGGLRYILANGDSNAVSGAKNTIMYAVVGLVIVLFAQVIVRFVFTTATADPPSGSSGSGTTGGSGGSGGTGSGSGSGSGGTGSGGTGSGGSGGTTGGSGGSGGTGSGSGSGGSGSTGN